MKSEKPRINRRDAMDAAQTSVSHFKLCHWKVNGLSALSCALFSALIASLRFLYPRPD